MADRSVSVMIILSDLQRRIARVKFSRRISLMKLVAFDVIRTTKFGRITRVEEERISRGLAMS